jgi:hypothetical protein
MIPYLIITLLVFTVLIYRGKYITEKKFSDHLAWELSKRNVILRNVKGFIADVKVISAMAISADLEREVRDTRINFKNRILKEADDISNKINDLDV